jgi:YggT family protein
MQTHPEGIEPTPTVATDRTESTTYDPYTGRRARSIKITRAIYLLFGLIEALLVIRFVLKALAANAEAGFAQLIYGVTGPLVAPFMGLFGTPQAAGGATLELHTLIAVVIYALVAWLLVRGAGLMFGEGRTASVARTDSVQTRHYR